MIKVKKLFSDAKIPTRKGDINKSAYIDLAVPVVEIVGQDNTSYNHITSSKSQKQVAYAKGDVVILHTGSAMELPEGTYGELLPRSSTFRKTGLIMTNSVGIIDHDYCGDTDEWMAMMYATRDGYITLGEDYLQFRVMNNMEAYDIEEVLTLGNADRRGYGSTDKEASNV